MVHSIKLARPVTAVKAGDPRATRLVYAGIQVAVSEGPVVKQDPSSWTAELTPRPKARRRRLIAKRLVPVEKSRGRELVSPGSPRDPQSCSQPNREEEPHDRWCAIGHATPGPPVVSIASSRSAIGAIRDAACSALTRYRGSSPTPNDGPPTGGVAVLSEQVLPGCASGLCVPRR